jgi:hypothetical protein
MMHIVMMAVTLAMMLAVMLVMMLAVMLLNWGITNYATGCFFV